MSASVIVLLGVVVLALVGLGAWSLGRSRPTGQGVGTVRRWASAHATTADGVTAVVHVEFTMRAEEGVLDPARDAEVIDAVEAAVRQAIAVTHVDALPAMGDTPDWFALIELPGITLKHAVVTASDVRVTPELRRLVADCTTRRAQGTGTWT